MKLTKNELRQMIKEELQKEGFMDSLKGAFGMGGEEQEDAPLPTRQGAVAPEYSMPKGFEGVQRDGSDSSDSGYISGTYNG